MKRRDCIEHITAQRTAVCMRQRIIMQDPKAHNSPPPLSYHIIAHTAQCSAVQCSTVQCSAAQCCKRGGQVKSSG